MGFRTAGASWCRYDAHYNAVLLGEGAFFKAELYYSDGATPVEIISRCLDRGDGMYSLAYTTFLAGRGLRLVISWRGMPVLGSPFSVNVAPGRAHAAHCYASGPGASYARLGGAATFRVMTFDRWRNKCTGGGEKLAVRSSGPTHPILSYHDGHDGTYRVSAKYGLSGVYSLNVCLARGDARLPIATPDLTVYAGLALAEQYLERWCSEVPRSPPALLASCMGPSVAGAPGVGGISGGGTTLSLASLGAWRHDATAVVAHSLRAWKLFVGRHVLSRLVEGRPPPGSPRVHTTKGKRQARAKSALA